MIEATSLSLRTTVSDLVAAFQAAEANVRSAFAVIVSSMKFKTKTILAKHLSLLFGNFETVAVDPF